MTAKHGIRICTVFGIPIKAEWTLLGMFALITWSLASAGLPVLAAGYTSIEYWSAAAITSGLLLVSLLAHELSHSVVARHYGIKVHDITLWLLGGMSRIERGPENPSQDLRIALAGPGTSLAIAIGAGGVTAALDVVGAPQIVLACTAWLASVNVLLAVFNMIPAAPLDGGRVLRAYLWRKRGDEASAAISATHAGRVFGYVLAGLGFVEFAAGEVTGLWLVLLGGFLLIASHAEETQVRMNRDLKDIRVRDVMTSEPITLDASLTVDEVLHDFVLRRHCSGFPVVDDGGAVLGLVTLRQLRQVPAYARATTRVDTIAVPLNRVRTSNPDAQLLDVLAREDASDDGRVLVFDEGRLVGIVSPSDVARAIQLAEFALAQPPTAARRS